MKKDFTLRNYLLVQIYAKAGDEHTIVNSPVWHLNVLRVQLTNCEPCHGRERRLTRIGEWETNNEGEISILRREEGKR